MRLSGYGMTVPHYMERCYVCTLEVQHKTGVLWPIEPRLQPQFVGIERSSQPEPITFGTDRDKKVRTAAYEERRVYSDGEWLIFSRIWDSQQEREINSKKVRTVCHSHYTLLHEDWQDIMAREVREYNAFIRWTERTE